MPGQPDEPDVAAAATELQESLEEMSTNLDELGDQMSAVADGYAEFGQSTRCRVDASAARRSGHTAADD